MSDAVLTYLYQYGVGGLIFGVSLTVLWRRGMLGQDPRVRRWRALLLTGGLALYAGAHAVVQFLLP